MGLSPRLGQCEWYASLISEEVSPRLIDRLIGPFPAKKQSASGHVAHARCPLYPVVVFKRRLQRQRKCGKRRGLQACGGTNQASRQELLSTSLTATEQSEWASYHFPRRASLEQYVQAGSHVKSQETLASLHLHHVKSQLADPYNLGNRVPAQKRVFGFFPRTHVSAPTCSEACQDC